jgi:hypothetical protein
MQIFDDDDGGDDDDDDDYKHQKLILYLSV